MPKAAHDHCPEVTTKPHVVASCACRGRRLKPHHLARPRGITAPHPPRTPSCVEGPGFQ